MEAISVSGVIPASSDRVYAAFLDSAEHAAMTGGGAHVEPVVGGRFTAWDGYITGAQLELVPGQRIVQTWRSSEFPAAAPDSRLEIDLKPARGGTRITFLHSGIPDGQGASYKQGWRDYYLTPMRAYFRSAPPENR